MASLLSFLPSSSLLSNLPPIPIHAASNPHAPIPPPASFSPIGRPSQQKLGVRCHSETEVAETPSRLACPPIKPEIGFKAFQSVDLRVGLITDAKAVHDPEMSAKRGKPTLSRKYLQLSVDIGSETRTVVSECKYVMDVEDAVGKKVLFVANVPSTEVYGVRSHGLVLMGLNYDPTPMPRSFKVILPGFGRLPPGAQLMEASIPL